MVVRSEVNSGSADVYKTVSGLCIVPIELEENTPINGFGSVQGVRTSRIETAHLPLDLTINLIKSAPENSSIASFMSSQINTVAFVEPPHYRSRVLLAGYGR